jgi:hypothetical protein
MAAIRVPSEPFGSGDKTCSKGIEMEIADEFQEIWFFLDHD